jgi:uncharacterized membrane protein YGL010W
VSPALRSHFTDYSRFHATPGNQACHYFAIPLIVYSVFVMLARVPLFEVSGYVVTAAELVLLASVAYYLTLDAPLGVLMFVFSALLVAAGRQTPFLVGLGLFLFGWVIQFVGHYVYEKKSPAFYRNLVHLLVGPLWVLAKATGRS